MPRFRLPVPRGRKPSLPRPRRAPDPELFRTCRQIREDITELKNDERETQVQFDRTEPFLADLETEIADLKRQLRTEQNPNEMRRIQNMIASKKAMHINFTRANNARAEKLARIKSRIQSKENNFINKGCNLL